jgi:hypothetical protein
MKSLKKSIQVKNFLLAAISTVMLFSLNSCATKANFLASSVVPAAGGTAKVKKDNNKNYVISINLYNLAEADKLNPPRKTYIVWMVTDDDATKNLGQISTSSSLFSKQLKASFETVSSFKPKKIFLTAEDEPVLQEPGAQMILSTDFFSVQK